MSLELKAEDDQIIARGIEAGVISRVADVMQIGVEVVRRRLEERAALPAMASRSEWSTNLHNWIEGHQGVAPLLPDEAASRESIYDARG